MQCRVLIDTLRHDGELLQAGTTVELTEAQARPLLGLGAVEAMEAAGANPDAVQAEAPEASGATETAAAGKKAKA